jgi:hypothetical protein
MKTKQNKNKNKCNTDEDAGDHAITLEVVVVVVKSKDKLADGRSRGEIYEATRRQRQADSCLDAGEAKPESES